jgi:hypothetical protein
MPQPFYAPPISSENPQLSVQASASGAAAAINANLSQTAGFRTYLAGIYVTGFGATASATATVTISVLSGGNLTLDVAVPAGATTPLAPLFWFFNPPLPANAAAQSITIQLSSFGAGNTEAHISSWGFKEPV